MALNKKMGIFGGTFNPIHYGRLLIAENACAQFDLDHVIFLPTGHAPHKQFMGEDMSVHRCRMVEAAIADNPKFSISYREIQNSGVNYTYATLQQLHQEHPECELYFILGADSLFDFDDWRHPELICQYAKILAAVRGNWDEERVDGQMCEDKGEYIGMREARSHAAWYLHGLRGAAALRRMCCGMEHFEDLDAVIARVWEYQREEAGPDAEQAKESMA